MIAHLTGRILSKTTQSIVIDATGVGYEVHVPLSTFYVLPDTDEPVSLYIHTHVREDALQLFGFHTRLERSLFLLLISVAGIGPKLAGNVLSGIGPQELLTAMAQGDAPRLQAIPGVGRKTAERIALELRDRASRLTETVETVHLPDREPEDEAVLNDALSALVNLGYTAKNAKRALEQARDDGAKPSLEGLIKNALRHMP